MPKSDLPKIVTANDLLAGDVIYQTATGWSRSMDAAEVLHDPDTAAARLTRAAQQTDRVVGAYLADVALHNGTPGPVHFREAFRATGPSNYAHGKQADRAAPTQKPEQKDAV